jgi:hypothetical protein
MYGTGMNPLQRVALAFRAFFAVLLRPEVALAVREVCERREGALPAGGSRPAAPAPGAPAGATPAQAVAAAVEGVSRRTALQLLGVLQREGRLVDFIEEDLTGYPDASVGAAARTVHAGCKRAIQELFRLEPVLRQPEGATVEVAPGFDPGAVRLTGNVVGKPPFKGSLRHHGWRAQDVNLPAPADGIDPAIVAPAEVEL